MQQASAAPATTVTPAGDASLMAWLHDPLAQGAIKIVAALVLLWLGIRIGRWLANLEHGLLLRANVDEILAQFLRNLTQLAIVSLVIVSALELAGFPSASLLAVLGAAGLAVGLALKDSLSHIAAGVLLIVLRPFRVGDRVNIANQEGVVEGVFIFQTRLRTLDNRDIVLMNGSVIAAPIINFSTRSSRQTTLDVLLEHASNLADAIAGAKAAAGDVPAVLATPAPNAVISTISKDGVQLSLSYSTAIDDVVSTRSAVLQALHGELAKRGITLASATTSAPKPA